MQDDQLKKWEVTDSKYLVNDRWMKLRAETCVTPDGHTITPFYVMEYGEWVNCVVLSEEGEVTLLRHYRHAANEYVLEIVGGMVEEGETPEYTIGRELEEEVGLVGADLQATGICYPNPQTHTNKLHCFIAIGGTFDGQLEDEAGANFIIQKMPLKELMQKIESGEEMFQSLHLSSILFALGYLKKHRPDLLPS